MNNKWFKNARSPEDKERMKRELQASVLLFDAFRSILEDELDSLQKDCASNERFENPAWAEQTAFNLGRQKQIYFILSLIPDQEK